MRLAQDFLVGIPVLRFSDRLTKARQILRDDRFRELYVIDDKKRLIGYIDITDGLRITSTKSDVIVEGFVRDAAEVHRQDTVEQVTQEICTARTDSAVVIGNGRQVEGAVLLSDLFPAIISGNELRGTVSDRMSRPVVVVKDTDTVQQVYTMMMESGYTAFPVISKRKLAGIISRRDLIARGSVRTALTHASRTPIGGLMQKNVVTTEPDEPVSSAATLLVRHDVSRLPVVNGGQVVGILGRHDALAAVT
jgi:CBS domain-containing protein